MQVDLYNDHNMVVVVVVNIIKLNEINFTFVELYKTVRWI